MKATMTVVVCARLPTRWAARRRRAQALHMNIVFCRRWHVGIDTHATVAGADVPVTLDQAVRPRFQAVKCSRRLALAARARCTTSGYSPGRLRVRTFDHAVALPSPELEPG